MGKWINLLCVTALAANVSFAGTGYSQEAKAVADEQSDAPSIQVSGRVTDRDGKPVRDALIVCPFYANGKQTSVTAHSADDGTFRLTLPRDHDRSWTMYHTWAYAKGHGIRTVALSRLIRRDLLDDESVQLVDVEIPLPPPGNVTRTVLNPDGSPCADAKVRPRHVDVPNGVYASDEPTGLTGFLPDEFVELLSQKTDATGSATFTAVPDALLGSVLVSTKEYGDQDFQNGVETFRLAEVGSISGMIVGETLTNLEGSIVHVESIDTSRTRRGIKTFVIGPETQFHIPAIATGRLTVRLAWSDPKTRPIIDPFRPQLDPGQELKLQIHAEPAIEVMGRLLTEDTRKPVVGASVSVRNKKSPHSSHTLSDERGDFRAFVSAGKIDVQITTMGKDSAIYKKYSYPSPPDFELSHGTKKHDMGEVLFPEKEIIRGRVINHDGTPWANHVIGLHTGAYRHLMGRAKTDAQGAFEMRVRSRRSVDPRRIRWVVIGESESPADSNIKETLEVVKQDFDGMQLRRPGQN